MIRDASTAPRTRLCLRIRPGIRASSFSPLFSGGFLEGHSARRGRKSCRDGYGEVGLGGQQARVFRYNFRKWSVRVCRGSGGRLYAYGKWRKQNLEDKKTPGGQEQRSR